MADIIKHRGIVEKVEGAHVVVRIVQTSACAACSAKGLCNASESKEKQIDVYEVNAPYRVGEEVMVCGTTSMGMRAVVLARLDFTVGIQFDIVEAGFIGNFEDFRFHGFITAVVNAVQNFLVARCRENVG